ncbi:MAG: hypothetical protein HYV33_05970 [Candidatus Kerfeldbacteria bacterium]|nr:hypothetical protein [Candidatus Kerfeldbacteria bacterium]
MTPKAKFAVIFFLGVVLVALGMQLVWRLYPQLKPKQDWEEILTVNTNIAPLLNLATTNTTTTATDDNITVTATAIDQAVLEFVGTNNLPHSLQPTIVVLPQGYLLGWLDGTNYFVQQYDTNWQAQGDQHTLAEQLPLYQQDRPQPQLYLYQDQVYLLIILEQDGKFQQQLKQFVLTDFSPQHDIRLIDETWNTTKQQYYLNQSRLAITTAGTIVLATMMTNDTISVSSFTATGQLLQEQQFSNHGQLIDLYSDRNSEPVVISYAQGIISFTTTRKQYQLALPTNLAPIPEHLIGFIHTPEYLLFVDATTIWTVTEDLLHWYSPIILPASVAHPQLSFYDKTVMIAYDQAATSIVDNTTVTNYSSAYTQYIILPLPDQTVIE